MARLAKPFKSHGLNLFQRALYEAVEDFDGSFCDLGRKMGVVYGAAPLLRNYIDDGEIPSTAMLVKLEYALDLPRGYLYNLLAEQIVSDVDETVSSEAFWEQIERKSAKARLKSRETYRRQKAERQEAEGGRLSNEGAGENA